MIRMPTASQMSTVNLVSHGVARIGGGKNSSTPGGNAAPSARAALREPAPERSPQPFPSGAQPAHDQIDAARGAEHHADRRRDAPVCSHRSTSQPTNPHTSMPPMR